MLGCLAALGEVAPAAAAAAPAAFTVLALITFATLTTFARRQCLGIAARAFGAADVCASSALHLG